MPRGKATPLSKDKSDIKEWSGSIPNVLDIFSCKSYDELSKIVNDWLAGDDEKEEEEWGTSGNKTEAVNPTSQFGKSTQKSYSNIDDAFADLID
jgi:hypothetical protein